MENKIEVLVIKDSEGKMRPQAGIWVIISDSGRDMTPFFQPDIDKMIKQSKDELKVVRAELKEIN